MSDVNQAFLRAYVKNRAATTAREGAAPVQRRVDPPAGSVPPAPPQVAKAPQVSSVATSASPIAEPAASPAPASSHATPSNVRVGVWSALGVERGMKSVPTSQPAPAVVRNATTPVPNEATLPRPKPTSVPPTASIETPSSSPSLEALSKAWTKKRAPALTDLKPRTPAPNPVADEERAPSQVHVRIDLPYPTVPVQPPAAPEPTVAVPAFPSQPSVPATHQRTDPPASRTMAGPHSGPASQRSVDRQRLQELPLPVAFAPSWEVDTFFWPEVVTRLEQADPNAFRQIAAHIYNANHSGLQVLAVTSGERGVGRSTVAMHMARAAASAGLKVALVDADTANPSLIDQLRLDIQHGWQDCLFEAVPLEEVAVHSIADRITLFPLTGVVSQQQVHANLDRMSKLIRRITKTFDFVLLDSCRLNLDQRDLIGISKESVVDAAVVVVDTELSIKEKIDSAIGILQSMGLTSIGLIENFRS